MKTNYFVKLLFACLLLLYGPFVFAGNENIKSNVPDAGFIPNKGQLSDDKGYLVPQVFFTKKQALEMYLLPTKAWSIS
jgi:hypothetical protein